MMSSDRKHGKQSFRKRFASAASCASSSRREEALGSSATRLTRLERAALWAERRSETKAGVVRGETRPAPKPRQWAFTAMLERGELSPSQWQAAARVARALESMTLAAGEFRERVDGGRHADAHMRHLARLGARQALDHALVDQSAPRQRVIRAALTTSATLSQLARIYSPRSKSLRQVKAILVETCNRLLGEWIMFGD